MGAAISKRARVWLAVLLGIALLAAGLHAGWDRFGPYHYLPGDTAAYVRVFAPPSAPGSAATRAELDILLELQGVRSADDVAAADADRSTEVSRFFVALGLPENARLPRVKRLVDDVEDDVRRYVRAAKDTFHRLRPAEIEPRLKPCFGGVRAELSYPSGHATYAFVTALVLADLAPERRPALLKRAGQFAMQRALCGVHFPTDINAGHDGAYWIVEQLSKSPGYIADAAAARKELRAALSGTR